MEIRQERPPNFEAIRRVFPAATGSNVLFAWGDVLYVPGGGEVPPELLAHEQTHGGRQLAHTGGVEGWWSAYLTDRAFLVAEELEAHRAEYQAFCAAHEKGRARFLSAIASRLAGPLYRWPMPHERAQRLISAGVA